jgi:hypothetical protein
MAMLKINENARVTHSSAGGCLQQTATRLITLITMAGLLLGGGRLIARNPRGWDYPMFQDPALPHASIKTVLATPAYLHLWKLVFTHGNPLVDTQLCSVVKIQHKSGLRLSPSVMKILGRLALGQWKAHGDKSGQNTSRWQTAQIAALSIVGRQLADRSTSQLVRMDQHGSPALAMAIDPLLFGHADSEMIKTWMQRAADNQQPALLRCSAIQGIATSGDLLAEHLLASICFNRRNLTMVRLMAARALARMHFTGLDTQSAAHGSEAQRTMAVINAILTAGTGRASRLITLCQNKSSTITLIALRTIERSTRMSRQLLRFRGGRLAEQLSQDSLPSIRHAIEEVALRAGIAQSLPILFHQLADPRLYISDDARMAITSLARRANLHGRVVSDAMALVDAATTPGTARAQMQSLLILSRLHIQSATASAGRLLNSTSNRVVLAAVIALRRLRAAHDAPAIYNLAVNIMKREVQLEKKYNTKSGSAAGGVGLPGQYSMAMSGPVLLQSQTLSQALCMLGELRYRPAVPALVRLIPQFGPYANRSREAAIWAIGKIDAHHPDAAIGHMLLSRLNDAYTLPPEIDAVRAMSAIALARMGYKPALSSIESFALADTPAHSTYACIWAAKKMAGKIYPMPTIHQTVPRGFIKPTRR